MLFLDLLSFRDNGSRPFSDLQSYAMPTELLVIRCRQLFVNQLGEKFCNNTLYHNTREESEKTNFSMCSKYRLNISTPTVN